jgi:hypothetical protein
MLIVMKLSMKNLLTQINNIRSIMSVIKKRRKSTRKIECFLKESIINFFYRKRI